MKYQNSTFRCILRDFRRRCQFTDTGIAKILGVTAEEIRDWADNKKNYPAPFVREVYVDIMKGILNGQETSDGN